MMDLHPPTPGFLFISFLYRKDLYSQEKLLNSFSDVYGQAATLAPALNPLKDYYSKEMGPSDLLERFFALFTTPLPREVLLAAKLEALIFERKEARDDKRMVNVDVGFLTAENFLLATTKNYSHRMYLGQNIFVDLTLQYTQQEFHILPWTYPDYRDPEKIEFLSWGRSLLLEKTH